MTLVTEEDIAVGCDADARTSANHLIRRYVQKVCRKIVIDTATGRAYYRGTDE